MELWVCWEVILPMWLLCYWWGIRRMECKLKKDQWNWPHLMGARADGNFWKENEGFFGGQGLSQNGHWDTIEVPPNCGLAICTTWVHQVCILRISCFPVGHSVYVIVKIIVDKFKLWMLHTKKSGGWVGELNENKIHLVGVISIKICLSVRENNYNR